MNRSRPEVGRCGGHPTASASFAPHQQRRRAGRVSTRPAPPSHRPAGAARRSRPAACPAPRATAPRPSRTLPSPRSGCRERTGSGTPACRPAHHRPGARPGSWGTAAPRASTAEHRSNSCSGSGSRPCRCRRRSPALGRLDHQHLRERRRPTLPGVAAWSHISVCIAGASTLGTARSQRRGRRSSPVRAPPGQQVGRGRRDDHQSASWPSRTCGTSWTSDHTSVWTGWCDSAAQFAAPTTARRSEWGTTRTSCPPSTSTEAALQACKQRCRPRRPAHTRRAALESDGIGSKLLKERSGPAQEAGGTSAGCSMSSS